MEVIVTIVSKLVYFTYLQHLQPTDIISTKYHGHPNIPVVKSA